MQDKISVYIITGFLGSGKTTVLNHLLSQFANKKNVVIENEFGKINIDATLVNGAFESVYELTNGCICCSINNQLLQTLSEICGLEQKPQNLFLETTGIADAGEVAATFKNLYIEKTFDLKKINCCLDAVNMELYEKSNIEIHKQIVASDLILINKTEVAELENIVNVKELVKTINPFAEIVLSEKGNFDSRLLNTKRIKNSVAPTTFSKNETAHKIKTLLFETDNNFDIQRLKYELFRSLYLYYNQIFRIKGYVLNEKKEVFLVQSVGKTSTVTLLKDINIEKKSVGFYRKRIRTKIYRKNTKKDFY